MNRTWTRTAVALTAGAALATAACRKSSNDQMTTGSQGGMTATPMRDSAPPEPASRRVITLARGTELTAAAMQTISSRTTEAGARIEARVRSAVLAADGDTAIPAGAVLVGRVTEIHTAPHPGASGTLQLSFDSLRVAHEMLPVATRITSVHTELKGRGVTTTDAAKVGAGAVIGGLAGRIIGHNTRGTVIGAATGAAAGAVVAHNTRTIDIVLPAGSAIHLVLTQPFDRTLQMMARRQ